MTVGISLKTVGVQEFEDNCLLVLREVGKTGETVIVTRDEVPIACISAPVQASDPVQEQPVSLFGRCAGELEVLGDIMSPAFGIEEFDIESRLEQVLNPSG